MTESKAGLRGLLKRIASSRDEHAAAELRQDVGITTGATPLTECANGTRVSVAGRLTTVTLRPRAGVPALEAELFDGSGRVDVVWLGRRRIGGIEPGRRIVVHGRITDQQGRRMIFNPSYELKP